MKIDITNAKTLKVTHEAYSIGGTDKCVLAIDGSTTNTGIAVFSLDTGELKLVGHYKRSTTYESPTRFKLMLKAEMYKLISFNHNITDIVYEEPVIENASAVKNLYMLRSMIEELLIEKEDELSYITYEEVSNSKWKKLFLAPMRVPTVKNKAKALVSQKFNEEQPLLTQVTQDEKDAYGLGKVYVQAKDKKELESKKALRPFKYNTYIFGTSVFTDELDIENLMSRAKVPEKVKANGVKIIETTGRKDFDKQVIEAMRGEDKLLLFMYDHNKLNSLLLRFNLGGLAQEYERIGIFVWRANRKTQVKYKI